MKYKYIETSIYIYEAGAVSLSMSSPAQLKFKEDTERPESPNYH